MIYVVCIKLGHKLKYLTTNNQSEGKSTREKIAHHMLFDSTNNLSATTTSTSAK